MTISKKMSDKKKWIIITICILVVFTLFAIKAHYDYKNLNENGRYTIGAIIKVEGGKGSKIATVSFFYNHQEIIVKVSSYKVENSDLGRRVFVKFSPKNPSTDGIFLLLDRIVVDIEPPKDGWQTIDSLH